MFIVLGYCVQLGYEVRAPRTTSKQKEHRTIIDTVRPSIRMIRSVKYTC